MERDRDHSEFGMGTLRSSRYALVALSLLYHLSDSATMSSVAPEPHVLLFRRAKNADALIAAQQAQEMHSQLKPAGAGKNGRKK